MLNTEFVKKIKTHIKTVTSNLQENSYFSDHPKWEFLKYEIRKFSTLSQRILLKMSELYKQILKTELKLWNKV